MPILLPQGGAEQVAGHERVPVEQIVLCEILGALGIYLGSEGRRRIHVLNARLPRAD
jgi:hypothetical protein